MATVHRLSTPENEKLGISWMTTEFPGVDAVERKS